MSKGRLEAFSDGVIAVLITILVLELKVPHGDDWAALREQIPVGLAYVLSFVYLGIYWNNHHHMLMMTTHINGKILWANLHLLFWLSLVPFTTTWHGEHHDANAPAALYGVVLFSAGFAYLILQKTIIAAQGERSPLREAVGRDFKGRASAVMYLASIGVAYVRPWIADVIYVLVALMWLVPDKRIESKLTGTSE